MLSLRLGWRHVIAACFMLSVSTVSFSEKLTVAVASNFKPILQFIAADFTAETGHELRIVVASSGKLLAQIRQGAPFDIFLSADQSKPMVLEAAGLVVEGSRFTYAQGVLVLYSHRPELQPLSLQCLADKSVIKIALANPRLAPYGVAAEQVLKKQSRYAQLKVKLVMGENINQTYQFVKTANVDVAFVALSQLIYAETLARAAGKNIPAHAQWIIPQNEYAPIYQDAVWLKRAEHKSSAAQFMQFLQSSAVRQKIAAYGYKNVNQQGGGI